MTQLQRDLIGVHLRTASDLHRIRLERPVHTPSKLALALAAVFAVMALAAMYDPRTVADLVFVVVR